jgi:hypothetical protein
MIGILEKEVEIVGFFLLLDDCLFRMVVSVIQSI